MSLTEDKLETFRNQFLSVHQNILASNACNRSEPLEVCINRSRLQESHHVFQHKVDFEPKPVANQKSTGTCWIFASLNIIRIPFMKQFNLEEFEFSQTYVFFWDKVERSNYFLKTVVDTAKRGEPVDGRLVGLLLSEPISDGGQYDMFVNLMNKHGIVPKKCFQESYSSEASLQLNNIIISKLREFTGVLRKMVEDGNSDEEIQLKVDDMMSQIFRIVTICLGIPPATFVWEYYDKNKVYHKVGPITPKEFHEQYVRPYYDVNDKVCLVNDPRPQNPYGKLYTIDCMGNMVGGRLIKYNNQPVDVLLKAAADSVKNNEAVWFGCEVAKRFSIKLGLQDLKIHDYKLVFGVEVSTSMTKADRMIYADSKMAHAMAITGVTFNDEGHPTKWRVENSWGDDRGYKGYLLMTSEWFEEYVFEIVVDKKYLSQSILDVYNQEPTYLPLWDPMGVVAH